MALRSNRSMLFHAHSMQAYWATMGDWSCLAPERNSSVKPLGNSILKHYDFAFLRSSCKMDSSCNSCTTAFQAIIGCGLTVLLAVFSTGFQAYMYYEDPIALCENVCKFAQQFAARVDEMEEILTNNRIRKQRLVVAAPTVAVQLTSESRRMHHKVCVTRYVSQGMYQLCRLPLGPGVACRCWQKMSSWGSSVSLKQDGLKRQDMHCTDLATEYIAVTTPVDGNHNDSDDDNNSNNDESMFSSCRHSGSH